MTKIFLHVYLSLPIKGTDIIKQGQRKGQPVYGGWDHKQATSVPPKTVEANT